MANTISNKSSVKASAAKSSGNPLLRDKTVELDPDIHFYAIENVDDTEEVEESEILAVYDSGLAASKQNLVKRKFNYINTFDHEKPAVISAMRDQTVGVFEHLDIISSMDEEKKASLHAAHPQRSCA